MPAGSVNFRHFILGLVSLEPRSGYDIKRLLESLSWLVGNPSFGSLYPTLHALLEEGLTSVEVIPQRDKPSRKVYSITDLGRRVLKEWMAQPVETGPSLKSFVMRLSLASNFSIEKLLAHLQERRAQVEAHRKTLELSINGSNSKQDLKESLVLEYGLVLANAELEWLDSTLNQLSQQQQILEVVESN